MGLDEKAIEAVKSWRFLAATLHGQPVATQIAVQEDSICTEKPGVGRQASKSNSEPAQEADACGLTPDA